MSKQIRNLWIAIGIWALVITATVVFYFELWNAFYFFTGYRVVFPWTYDDVLLGWVGVVYDPEGKVATTRAREGSFFGCLFLGAKHLSEDWYLCTFWHR
jgi:hypothetical protein